MSDVLTYIEERALEAQSLPAFPVNLHEIRSAIRDILGEVQRYGFFDEYTTHSFDHVSEMLKVAEWLIPQTTAKAMTVGDFMMITLSCYFHDLGLLIGRIEYENRSSNPEFVKFISELEDEDSLAADYMENISRLGEAGKDKVLYQEFVRATHGNRVRAWIEGVPLDDNDLSNAIRTELQGLIGKLDDTTRRDLGNLCESHTRDDIDDIQKYNPSQPYGSDPQEWVNLQYTAAILRTADLLQITRKRAPSVLYRLINPVDPISQLEWQKQGAVRSVRARPGLNRSGQADANAVSDTIEVHARFREAESFFGLTSYLSYVELQLQATHAAIQRSQPLITKPYEFPWLYVNSEGVEAEGFLAQSFGFKIDQHKILDLLTGHMLYNDTSVVLRELAQNALDAVRLQSEIEKADSNTKGRVEITWDGQNRRLTVRDNGTGMTQQTIEEHFLKVGSSRYQDEKFREKHPEFSSISRFGIGVLSAFMIADDVEIVTCSVDDEKARRISLRSVHGKYLIQTLDKVADRSRIGVWPHGTEVSLNLRSAAKLGDVLQIAKQWLLFPRCEVLVTVDDGEPVQVGYKDPSQALESYLLASQGFGDPSAIEVRQVEEDGVLLAYAVRKDRLFGDWSFVEFSERARREEESFVPVATCVEGVAVEFTTPGFRTYSILALANATGMNAPKTNVARSAIDDNEEQKRTLNTIYRLYANHITNEIERLSSISTNSLSRSVDQAPFIAAPLVSDQNKLRRPALMQAALAEVPMVLVEAGGRRKATSASDIRTKGSFWTVESQLTKSVEFFVSEAPADISASTLLKTLGNSVAAYPKGDTVCNLRFSDPITKQLQSEFEIDQVLASEENRRLDLHWSRIDGEYRWLSSAEVLSDLGRRDRRFWQMLASREHYPTSRSFGTEFVAPSNLVVSGLEGYGVFSVRGLVHILPDQPIASFLRRLWSEGEVEDVRALAVAFQIIAQLVRYEWEWQESSYENVRAIADISRPVLGSLDKYQSEFFEHLRASNGRKFDPYAWERREYESDY